MIFQIARKRIGKQVDSCNELSRFGDNLLTWVDLADLIISDSC